MIFVHGRAKTVSELSQKIIPSLQKIVSFHPLIPSRSMTIHMKGDYPQPQMIRSIMKIEEFFDTENPSSRIGAIETRHFHLHGTERKPGIRLTSETDRGMWRRTGRHRGWAGGILRTRSEILEARFHGSHELLQILMIRDGLTFQLKLQRAGLLL